MDVNRSFYKNDKHWQALYRILYPPFTLLKETYLRYLREKKLKKSKKEKETELIRLWASAHGIASIACMSGVETSFEWEDRIFSDMLLR
jgi:hypothetical protein